jgi:hypothetical protein
MDKGIKKRGVLLFWGLLLGGLLGLVLNIFWFIFTLTVLGYGDSGPEWLIAVNNWIFIISMAICLIGSQVVHYYVSKKEKL